MGGRIGRATGLAVLVLGILLRLRGADADTVKQPATITREAYFTNPLTQVAPPLVRNSFPPATACLVAGLAGVPQVCGPEIQQITQLLGLSDGLPIPVTPDGDLAQPIVVPGTTPVGMLAGQQRYTSLLALAMPTLPSDQGIGSYQLVLHQDGINFALESPAMRDLVLQLVGQVEDQDPQKVVDALTRALSGKEPVVTDTVTGIEACPILEPWQAGAAQGAQLDGLRLPAVDCKIGTTGVYDAKAKTWTFDLTFAAQAWTRGTDGKPLDNQGVLLRPVGAPNLAYGDPDFSTNWLVSLADATAAPALRPSVTYTTAAVEDAAGADTGGVDLGGTTDLGSTSFEIPSLGDGGLTLGQPGGTPVGVLRARLVRPAGHGGKATTPGWILLAVPLLALGSFVFAESLLGAPATTRRRPGALSHLMAKKAVPGHSDDPPGAAP